MILERITVTFADDDEHHAFDGYTDGRRWNGWECPWFPVEIAEKALARISYRTRRASTDDAPHGGLWVNERDDAPTDQPYLLASKRIATVDGDCDLLDCGGWLVFQRASDADVLGTYVPCEHPEHRLGTHGRLKRNQRVCLNCGDVILVRR